MQNHALFGFKPDAPDARDHKLSFKAVDLNTLPKQIDLRAHCSPVENQSTLGSCTSNAVAGALEFLEIRDGVAAEAFENFSRLFIYYNGRELSGGTATDTGLSVREALYSMSKLGACDELLWPYEIERFAVQPNPRCYADAANHKVVEYLGIEELSDMLACLAAGFPFIFGFKVFDSFMSAGTARSGAAAMPVSGENSVGWHAVCAVGYDMEARTVLCRNSWGDGWGQGGYFTMPFDYIGNSDLAQDFWTIRRVGPKTERLSFPAWIVSVFKKLFGR